MLATVVDQDRSSQPIDTGAPAPALEAVGLEKWFGATHALRDVSLVVDAGVVHAVVGENGAGKSTLMRAIAGQLPASAYAGEIRIAGEPTSFRSVRDAEAAGVAMVAQELSSVLNLSVAENLFLNHEHTRRGAVDWRSLWRGTRAWLDDFGVDVAPNAPMAQLTTGQQQLVSIMRALARGARILILDEPTVSLSEAESEVLFDRLRRLRREGVTILYVSHRLNEVAALSDRVTVMRDGAIVERLDATEEALEPRRIVRAMLGRDIEQLYPEVTSQPGEVLIEARDLTVPSPIPGRGAVLDGVELSCRAGEILGVFGGVGSGTNELARVLFGAWPAPHAGRVTVRGESRSLSSPEQAIAAGVAYVPSERREALVPKLGIAENISLIALGGRAGWRMTDRRAELCSARDYIEQIRIAARSPAQPVGELSGGNQQKVVAAKWLAVAPRVFILEEPTQGIDIGARAELYLLMARLAEEGCALILISSELQEVVGMAHRGVVLHRGRAVGGWTRDDASEEELLHMATAGGA